MFGAVVGFFMLIFGVFFFATATKDGDAPGPVIAFVAIWLLICLAGIVYNLINATSGVPDRIIEVSEEESGQSPANATDAVPPLRPTADRLRELDNLMAAKLISDAEYQAKRQDLLSQL